MLVTLNAMGAVYLAIKYVMEYFTVPMETMNATAVSNIEIFTIIVNCCCLSRTQYNNNNKWSKNFWREAALQEDFSFEKN